jgi:uncharacterized protein (TIGR02246 family)
MTRARFALATVLLLPAGCAGPAPIRADEVGALLGAQADAWNRGDMPGFVAAYWQDERLTFFGGSGLRRGYATVAQSYDRTYPDAAARGRLRFELLEVRPLGDAHALVLGRYALDRAEPASGFFSLVVQRFPGGLRIVHDHTSADS